MLGDRWIYDRVPTERFPDYTRGNAGEVMAEPVIVTTCLEDEVREAFLVLTEAATREVVTILEVLSPTNKLPGSPGLESFTQK